MKGRKIKAMRMIRMMSRKFRGLAIKLRGFRREALGGCGLRGLRRMVRLRMAVVRRMRASQRSEGEVWLREVVIELRRLRLVEVLLKG